MVWSWRAPLLHKVCALYKCGIDCTFNTCSLLGLAFWKAPRRLIYAVTNESQKKSFQSRSKSSSIVIDSSDDDDFVQPLRKKKFPLENKIDALFNEIDDLKSKVDVVVNVTKEVNVPLPLVRMMQETFKCTICHEVPAKPPLIVSKCCKIIIGCDSCVNKWYSGPDALVKPCPACRHERGYNETMMLRGLDGFLEKTGQLIMSPDEFESSPISLDDN